MTVKSVIEQTLILLNDNELFEKINSFDLDVYAQAEYVKGLDEEIKPEIVGGTNGESSETENETE